MRSILTATRLSAIAFTPGLWAVSVGLNERPRKAHRTAYLRVIQILLLPFAGASVIACGFAVIKGESRDQLLVSTDRKVTATINDPTSSPTPSQPQWLRAILALVVVGYAALAAAVGLTVGAVSNNGPFALASTAVLILGPVTPTLWRYVTLHAKRRPTTRRRPSDLIIEGFARSPSSPRGHGEASLAQWVPPGRPVHGIAFAPLTTVYRRFARTHGRTFQRRIIGNAWRIGCWTVRPALYEVRISAHSHKVGGNCCR